MLTLYDMQISGNCYKVRLLLKLLRQEFESRLIEPYSGQSQTSSFKEINPNSSVPILVLEDGTAIAESNAILLYLAEETAYLPKDKMKRAMVYQWLFFEQYSHEPKIAVRMSLSLVPARAHEATKDRMASLLEGGNKALDVMEDWLSTNDYFSGDEFSVADIALYAYTHKAKSGGFDLTHRSAILAWLKRVRERDNFISIDWVSPNASALD